MKKIIKRKNRIRARLKKISNRLRLSVFRSNKHIYAQIIDDSANKTLAYVSDLKIKGAKSPKDRAKKVGEEIALACQKKKIKNVIFDKGGYQYSGLIKILADAARKKGLKF